MIRRAAPDFPAVAITTVFGWMSETNHPREGPSLTRKEPGSRRSQYSSRPAW